MAATRRRKLDLFVRMIRQKHPLCANSDDDILSPRKRQMASPLSASKTVVKLPHFLKYSIAGQLYFGEVFRLVGFIFTGSLL